MNVPNYNLDAPVYNALTALTGYARAPRRLVKLFETAIGPVQAGTQLLDFGCGTGRLSRAFYNACRDVKITGLEPSTGMASRYRNRFKDRTDNVLVSGAYTGDGLPFAAGQFDLVAAAGVFDHIAITPEVMSDFARVIRPGGHLAFTFERSHFSRTKDMSWDGNFYSHSPAYVSQCIERAGMSVKAQDTMTGYYWPRYAPFGLVIAQK